MATVMVSPPPRSSEALWMHYVPEVPLTPGGIVQGQICNHHNLRTLHSCARCRLGVHDVTGCLQRYTGLAHGHKLPYNAHLFASE